MARQTNPRPPVSSATPPSQPLVTPSPGTLPTEMVFMLAQQQTQQNTLAELSRLSREIGILNAELQNLKSAHQGISGDTMSIKRQHHLFLGGAAVIGISLAIVAFFFTPKLTVLLKMADERQVHDAQAGATDNANAKL